MAGSPLSRPLRSAVAVPRNVWPPPSMVRSVRIVAAPETGTSGSLVRSGTSSATWAPTALPHSRMRAVAVAAPAAVSARKSSTRISPVPGVTTALPAILTSGPATWATRGSAAMVGLVKPPFSVTATVEPA